MHPRLWPQHAAVRYLYERRAQAAVQARRPLVPHDGGERPADAAVVVGRRLRRQPGPQQVQRVRLQAWAKWDDKLLCVERDTAEPRPQSSSEAERQITSAR